MFNLGPMEVLVIVVVALVVLGPQRLPDAMRQVGKGVGEMRRWTAQVTNEVQSAFVPGAEAAPALPVPAPSPVPPPPPPTEPGSGAPMAVPAAEGARS